MNVFYYNTWYSIQIIYKESIKIIVAIYLMLICSMDVAYKLLSFNIKY